MNGKNMAEYLSRKGYPGRGVFLGRSADGRYAVTAYFIMGRSTNSRNRIFTAEPDGIRTEAFDPSMMTDPSLIIYHPVRILDGHTIVTNGDQTDTIRDSISEGHCFRHALMTREFEPDAPNYTPRISGIIMPDGSYKLSVLKSLNGDPACCCRYFFEYDHPAAGIGHLIHTYQDDGEPLPSFEGEPVRIVFDEAGPQELADHIWGALNEENKVSLYVSYTDIASGEADSVIINKHGEN